MRQVFRAALAASLAYALSSCTNITNYFTSPFQTRLFTISQSDKYINVNLLDAPEETYKMDRRIYSFLDSYIYDRDMEKLRETEHMREILETADVNSDNVINFLDAFAVLASRDRANRLIAIVNSHYPPDKPRLPLRD